MNFTYVLGFVVLRDVVKVFPVSSSLMARKTTGRNRAWSHSGCMTRHKDDMGSQIISSESYISHPILVYLSRNNNSQAQARRFAAWISSQIRIQVRSADECVAPGRRQPRETRWTSARRLSSPETNLKAVFFLPKVFCVPGRKFVDLDASWTLRTFFPSAMRLLRRRTTEIKIEVQSKYRGMNCEQFVSSLFTKHADVFPALCVVASAAAVLPVRMPRQSTFSTQNRILTKLWNRLLEGTLDQLRRICIEGPPSSQMDYRRALQLWRSQRTRRILWASLRRSRKIVPFDCRPMSRFTATLTCYLWLAQYSYYFLHLL